MQGSQVHNEIITTYVQPRGCHELWCDFWSLSQFIFLELISVGAALLFMFAGVYRVDIS